MTRATVKGKQWAGDMYEPSPPCHCSSHSATHPMVPTLVDPSALSFAAAPATSWTAACGDSGRVTVAWE